MIAVIGVKATNTSEVHFFDWLDEPFNIDTAKGMVLYFPSYPVDTESRLSTQTQVSFFKKLKWNIVRMLDSDKLIAGIGFTQPRPINCLLNYRPANREIGEHVFKDLPSTGRYLTMPVKRYFNNLKWTNRCILNPELFLKDIKPLIYRPDYTVSEISALKRVYVTTEDHKITCVGLFFKFTAGKEYTSKEFILVPPIHDLTAIENINVALQAFYNITLVPEPPEWVTAMMVAGQEELHEDIAEKEEKLTAMQTDIDSLRDAMQAKRRCVRLLYSTGNDLIEAVKEALEELGFTWPDHVDIDEEDGFIEISGRKAVLEISGFKGNIDRAKLRQCLEWVDKFSRNGEQLKGIYIANPQREKVIAERNIAEMIHRNEIKFAENNSIAILLASDLFDAVAKKREGKFDLEIFSKALFDCNGLFGFEY